MSRRVKGVHPDVTHGMSSSVDKFTSIESDVTSDREVLGVSVSSGASLLGGTGDDGLECSGENS